MIPCPAGYMCDGTGNTDSTKVDCPAGYYCPGGVGVGIGVQNQRFIVKLAIIVQ